MSWKRRTSSISRSGKSPSQSTQRNDRFYRRRPCPGPRDLGPMLRVYNSNGTDSEMTDVCCSLPIMARGATKRCVEGNPKLTEDHASTGFEILSCQRVEHVEADKEKQPTDQGGNKRSR